MLSKKQQKLYNDFYESTHNSEYLDRKTELLVGLSAAMAMSCEPCIRYYLQLAKRDRISDDVIGEVLAKVMAVAAGKKRLQFEAVVQRIVADEDDPG